jgi:hypothetical protein
MRRRLVHVSILVALAILVVAALPAVASADLLADTTTNPNQPPFEWRQSWGHSLHPDFSIQATGTTGFFYVVDRTQNTFIDTSQPGSYLHATLPDGTHLSKTLDIPGTYEFPPPGGWNYSIPGMHNVYEGVWWFHVAPYSENPTSGVVTWGNQVRFKIGIDLTPPAPVRNVLVSADPSIPGTSTAVAASSRATVSWGGVDYDDLSGSAYYRLYMDGTVVLSGGNDGTNPVPGSTPFWFNPASVLPYNVTIEDLTPGRHVFEVSSVDRATNEGPKSAAGVFFSDPDTPSVTITSPTNSLVSASTTIAATATDLAAVRDVTISIDSTVLRTVTTSGDATSVVVAVKGTPSNIKNGSHTLYATVHDMLGRAVTVSKAITVDKISPSFSKVTHGPTPFFPIRHDRYKDTETVSFTLSERSTVKLSIFDSTGAVIRSFSAVRSAGRSSFVWNGHWSDGKVAAGRYYYQLSAVDGYGNSSSTGKLLTQIKSYELKRLARNRVIVIPR